MQLRCLLHQMVAIQCCQLQQQQLLWLLLGMKLPSSCWAQQNVLQELPETPGLSMQGLAWQQ
jgi:hypothetical protein